MLREYYSQLYGISQRSGLEAATKTFGKTLPDYLATQHAVRNLRAMKRQPSVPFYLRRMLPESNKPSQEFKDTIDDVVLCLQQVFLEKVE
tara:strand:+ start:4573 stop:4842 length:270 start_codon:yes stop_codon:yes gene_type:complete